jgi:hypothetical protein
MGWFMLDKYYTMTEDAPVYAAALLLDPSKRMKYIERHWPEPWHDNAISGARAIWEEEYKTHSESGPIEVVGEMSTSQKRQRNEWDSLLEEMEVTEDMGNSVDDFEDFIRHPLSKSVDHHSNGGVTGISGRTIPNWVEWLSISSRLLLNRPIQNQLSLVVDERSLGIENE